jgi:TonB family protein
MKTHLCLAAFAAAVFCAQGVRAQEDVPSYRVLECESGCPQITAPVKLSHEVPHFPLGQNTFLGATGGILDVSFTIGKDGHVKDVIVERRIGPASFEDAALAVMQGWLYTPAMQNGVPVEDNERTRFTFLGWGAARPEIETAYKKAIDLHEAGKLDEALAALGAISAREDLNLFERSMTAYAAALIYVEKGDYANALEQSRVAMIANGRALPKSVRADATRLEIKLEAANGNAAEAFTWYKTLTDQHMLTSNDPSTPLIDKLHARVDAPEPLVTDAKIQPELHTPLWHHTLARRTFAFSALKGKLNGFDLRCKHNRIQSPVSDTAQWTVPSSWSDCEIYVQGAPDSTFQFVELKS